MKKFLIGSFRLRNFLENQFWRKNENGFFAPPFPFSDQLAVLAGGKLNFNYGRAKFKAL
jgi:hypothetical protein